MLVRDSYSRALVIQRGQEPEYGLWAVPGGRVEWGETLEDAASRELQEECGLKLRPQVLLHVAEIINASQAVHFVVLDYGTCLESPQAVKLGSDAKQFRWITPDQIAGLAWAQGMRRFLESATVRKFLHWPLDAF